VSELSPLVAAVLLAWGVVAGLDLVSAPQMMISRPLIAGAVAGGIIGDWYAGLAIGLVLELFALESLAIGAARYPDYGAATVGAVVAGSGRPLEAGLGMAVILGLVLAAVGGWTMRRLRRANGRAVKDHAASLDMGDPVAVRALQVGGLVRDLIRCLVLAGVALLAGLALRESPPLPRGLATPWSIIVIGGGLASAASGAIRAAGRGRRLRWLGLGGLAGLLAVVLSR